MMIFSRRRLVGSGSGIVVMMILGYVRWMDAWMGEGGEFDI